MIVLAGIIFKQKSFNLKPFEQSEILSVNLFRDGFVSSFTMIMVAEIADKTFFIAAILGTVSN